MLFNLLVRRTLRYGALAALTLAGCNARIEIGPPPNEANAMQIRKALASSDTSASASATESTEAPASTGWATLRGMFKYAGSPPARGKLLVTKDFDVCAKNGSEIPDNSLLVGPSGGIANVVIYARVKRVHDSAQPLKPESQGGKGLLFDQKSCMFVTHVVAIQVGRKLDIKNSDPVGHNTKIDPTRGPAFNQTVPVGETLSYVTAAEETFPASVSCSIHPWMKAYLLPRADKYFAVTADDGSFEIVNLPAGEEIELQVWHERSVGPQGALVVNRPELKWSKKGRFRITLAPDETKQLDVEVPVDAFN